MITKRQIILAITISLISFSLSAEEKVLRGAKAIRDGDQRREAVHVDLSDELYPSKVIDLFRSMPKLQTLVVGGPRYTDQHLDELAKIASLKTIILDSTDVTDRKIKEIVKEHPRLAIHRSQKWAINQIADIHELINIDTRLSDDHAELQKLLGSHHFKEATHVDFSRLPDVETGPFDPILNEKLAPIRHLRTLTYLDLTWTRLNDAGMNYLKGLTQLESLRIPTGEISIDGLIHIRNFTALKSFTGRMSDDGLKHISGLKNLQSLDISGPQLTDEGLQHLTQLQSLKTLYLKDSKVAGSGLHHLTHLPLLESIDLSHSQLSDLSHLAKYTALQHLHIDDCKINDAALSHLAECGKLETLSLDQTDIGDVGVAHLKSLTKLRSLSFKSTRVGDAGVVVLKSMPALRSLNLSRSRVSNKGLKHLQEFPQLRHLIAYGLPINEEGLRHLEGLQKLDALYINLPLINNDYEARQKLYSRLRKSLPNCNVQ